MVIFLDYIQDYIFEYSENVVKYFPKILYLTVTVQDDRLLPSDYLNGIFSGQNLLVKMAQKYKFFENFRFFGKKSESILYLTVTVHDDQNYHGLLGSIF